MDIRSACTASVVLLLLSSLCSFVTPSAGARAELVTWECNNGTYYAENSTYQSNVRTLLASLAANASRSLFATAVVGAGPDTVWGLGLCRGDATNGTECASSCLALAPEVAFGNGDYCMGAKDVAIFYDRCTIRYSSRDFLTRPNNWEVQSRGSSDVAVVPRDAGQYEALVASLLGALADFAVFNTSSRYATGVMVSDQALMTTTTNYVVHMIYGLVQCTPDQEAGPCWDCLRGLIDKMPEVFYSSVGGLSLAIWCNLRFEKQVFYDGSPMLRLVAPQQTPPPPSPFMSTDGTRRQHAATVTSSSPNIKSTILRVVISVVGSVLGFIFILAVIIFIIQKRRTQRQGEMEDEEEDFGNLQGTPMRFTFQQLEVATGQFRNKLGEGGFGSVFKGRLGEETIAVKRLDRAGQGKREFLAEVQTIGNIHHINLVRLFGFCAEKSHRLLVYEYMPNGSLDKWIYCRHDNSASPLKWRARCKIITSIAKGLSYLHEECMKRIAHLDVKPQNILLDETFNAKLSDFGLCKLIDRDLSQVVTRMRGTPGYLAPEWLKSQITEKVDVYSFGVVVMEIISGRKNLDTSRSEESMHLVTILEEKVKSDQLVDLVDKNSDDMQAHEQEVIHMIKLAMWCLQIDCKRRPPMSDVVKVLEGTSKVETNIGHNFVATSLVNSGFAENVRSSTPPLASDVSGPR